MKRRLIAVTLAGISCLLLSTHANAMTDKEATTLAWAAYKGNQADFAQLEQAAKSGSLPAQFGMGEIYLWENNYPLSAQWFQAAAEKGDPGAENALGFAYQNGQGVSQNYGTASAWYYKAAQQGNAKAESNLGHMYYSGWGVAKNYATAAYWLKKAAAQGYGLADAGLGDMYLYGGYGVQINPGIALYWFKEGVSRGSSDAEEELGAVYYAGYGGVPQNVAEGVRLLRCCIKREFNGHIHRQHYYE